MGVGIRVSLEGQRAIQNALKNVSPKFSPIIIARSLYLAASAIQADASDIQIVGGGRGKGKALSVLPHRLTARNGGAGIRGSFHINEYQNRVEVGSTKKYAAIHEFGGEVDRYSKVIKEHKRTVVFGRKVKPFTVKPYLRLGHTATYPERPFLQPALDKIAPQIPAIFVKEWNKALQASVSGGGR